MIFFPYTGKLYPPTNFGKVYGGTSFGLHMMGEDWGSRKRSRALVREISPQFTDALASYFGTGPTDIELSRQAHSNYVAALRKHGVDVHVLPGLPDHPDCTFVEDTGVVFGDVVVIPHMGHPSREGEQSAVKEYLAEFLTVYEMPEGATLDGGDVIFFDDKLLIGESTRTNLQGISFLQNIAESRGFDTMVFKIPNSTLHLTTVCSSPQPGLLITAEGHLTPEDFAPLVENGVDVVWVPNEESYAANVIGFEDGFVIVSEGYPKTKAILQELGFTITCVDMEHIRSADGSLTCCSIFY